MIASDWVGGSSVVVGDQAALVGRAGFPVPPDRGRQRQQPLRHADMDAGQCPSLVTFQPELVFEGVEGALDPLPEAAQRAMPGWLISTIGTQQHRAVAPDQLLKVAASQTLVGQQDQPRPQPGTLV